MLRDAVRAARSHDRVELVWFIGGRFADSAGER